MDKMRGCRPFQIQTFKDATVKYLKEIGTWYNYLQAARDLATWNNMKATTRAEQDHNKKAELHDYKVGQQILLDERNFLNKISSWRLIGLGLF